MQEAGLPLAAGSNISAGGGVSTKVADFGLSGINQNLGASITRDIDRKKLQVMQQELRAAKAAADLISKANRGEYAADYYESVNEGEAFYGTLKAGTVYYNDYNGCYCIKKSGYFDDPIKLKRQTAPAQKKTKGRKTNVK